MFKDGVLESSKAVTELLLSKVAVSLSKCHFNFGKYLTLVHFIREWMLLILYIKKKIATMLIINLTSLSCKYVMCNI